MINYFFNNWVSISAVVVIYFAIMMPVIYFVGGAIRKHNNCDMQTGEPLD